MELADALDFIRTRHTGVLATLRTNGRPQLSNVGFGVDDAGIIRVSITDARAKTRNISRDPRVTLHVTAEQYHPYVVIDGMATLSEVTTTIGDAAGLELVEYYRSVSGEHPDWDEYQQAMIDDQRLVLRITPERAYGLL